MTQSTQFEWDDENINHIARHGVSVEDAEYVLLNPTLYYGRQDWHDEIRFADVGQTAAGRVLVAVTTERGFRMRVVTAYDADNASKQEYFLTR